MKRTFPGICLIMTPMLAQAADVSFFGISKLQDFVQSPGNAPVAAEDGFSFVSFAICTNAGALTNATVRRSGTSVTNYLLPQDSAGLAWQFQEKFNSQSALDAAYPTGSILNQVSYSIVLFTVNDGVRSVSLNFWTILGGYPATPTINNLEAAQNIDTTADFTLTWNSLGGSSLDIVQLTIVDASSNLVFISAAPFQPDALTGSSTSAVIPANRLPPGMELTGHLLIARPGLPNTNYATGLAAFSKDTSFPIVTRPAPTPPMLTVDSESSGMRVSFTAEPARNYHLQASEDFVSWSDLLVTNPPSSSVSFFDSGTALRSHRFYRVQVGP